MIDPLPWQWFNVLRPCTVEGRDRLTSRGACDGIVLLPVGAKTAQRTWSKYEENARRSRTKTDTVGGLLPDKKVKSPAAETRATSLNPQTFLAKVGQGKTTLQASKGQLIFSQGDAADAVFMSRRAG